LLACGVAGAIAGIFKAPIAATIFALEVLMIDLSMWSIIPLLLASVSGAMVSYFLMGDNVMFNFTLHDSFEKKNIAYYLVLGLTCGFISVAFMRQLSFFEKKMAQIKHVWQKITIGTIVLGILIFMMPPLFGEGYLTLQFLQGNNPEQITHLRSWVKSVD
jgi:CIC family chloride channel protein